MRCPYCDTEEDKVVDSRVAEEGRAIRRRSECLNCGRRYTTFERAEEVPLFVVKRNGEEELFDRSKIIEGIRRSIKNRPVTDADDRGTGRRRRGLGPRDSSRGPSRRPTSGARCSDGSGPRRGRLPALRLRVQGLPGTRRLRARARPTVEAVSAERQRDEEQRSMKIPVRILDPDLPLPRYASEGDAGLDLIAARGRSLRPGGQNRHPHRHRRRDPPGLRRLRPSSIGSSAQRGPGRSQCSGPHRLGISRRDQR